MALVTLISYLVKLHLLFGMLCVMLNAYIPCSNDCGFTTLWTEWSCDSCLTNGQFATRARGLCCYRETKDHCLSRCHKRNEDINQFVPCQTKCKNGQLVTTAPYSPSTEASSATYETNTLSVSSHLPVKSVTSNLESSSIVTTFITQSTLGSTVTSNSNFDTITKQSTIDNVQKSNSSLKISSTKQTITAKRSSYLTTISPATRLEASGSPGPTRHESTNLTQKHVSYSSPTKESTRLTRGWSSTKTTISSHTSSTTQPSPGIPGIKAATTGLYTFDLSSSNSSNSSMISTVPSSNEPNISFSTRMTTSAVIRVTADLDPPSDDGNYTRKVTFDKACTWLCLNIMGKKECGTECMKPLFLNFCEYIYVT